MTTLEGLRAQVYQHLLTLDRKQLEDILKRKHRPVFEVLPCFLLGKFLYFFNPHSGRLEKWDKSPVFGKVEGIFKSGVRNEYLVFGDRSVEVMRLDEKGAKLRLLAQSGCQKVLEITPGRGRFALQLSNALLILSVSDRNRKHKVETLIKMSTLIEDFGILEIEGRKYAFVLSGTVDLFNLDTFDHIWSFDGSQMESTFMDESGRFFFLAENRINRLKANFTGFYPTQILSNASDFALFGDTILVVDDPVDSETGRLTSTDGVGLQRIGFMKDSTSAVSLSETFAITSGEHMSTMWRCTGNYLDKTEVFVFQEFKEVFEGSVSFPPPEFLKRPYLDFLVEYTQGTPREILRIVVNFCVVE